MLPVHKYSLFFPRRAWYNTKLYLYVLTLNMKGDNHSWDFLINYSAPVPSGR